MPGLSLDAVPPAPREPSPRARELIFRYQGSQKVLLLVGAIFLAIGVLLSVPMNWGLPSDLALSVGGRPMRARVISRELNRSVTINGRHPTEIRFAYTVDGQRFTGRSSTMD